MSKDQKTIKDESKEQIPLNVILKFIKPFDGTREKLNPFINNCDNAVSLASSLQENIVFKYIISQLDGKAEVACSIKEFDSWPQLREFLQNQFGERKHYAHLLTDLQDCRQGTQENVSQFSLKVETCLSKLLTEISITNHKKSELSGRVAAMEELALHTFTMGLNPRIANIIRCRDPKNLNEAINYAISEEKIQQYTFKQNMISNHKSQFRRSDTNKPSFKTHNLNNNHSNQPKPSSSSSELFCRYCKRNGHSLENCRIRENNNKRFDKSKYINNSNVQPSTSGFKPRIDFKPQIYTTTAEEEEEEEEGYDTVDSNDNLN